MKNVKALVQSLQIEKVSDLLYKGKSTSIGTTHVYGGQVLSQSLLAMYQTMDSDRFCHSIHGYFLEAGNLNIPILFEVEILRDGGSFSTRRVTALQNDTVIFVATGSFQLNRSGLSHQIDMPIVKQPDDLLSWKDVSEQLDDFLPKPLKHFLSFERPMDFKQTIYNNPLEEVDYEPHNDYWFKVKGQTTELDRAWLQVILAYISDYNMLTTTLQPHASQTKFGDTLLASLDHNIWFHQEFDLDDWILFSIESPITKNERGMTNGKMFSKEGKLIASVAQEGLLRQKK